MRQADGLVAVIPSECEGYRKISSCGRNDDKSNIGVTVSTVDE
jgi:hypothetical protein